MKKVKTTAFSAVNPVFSFERDKIIFKDGRVGIGFLLQPAEMERWTAEEYEGMQNTLLGLLKTLPPNSVFQKTDAYYQRPYIADARELTYFEGKMHKHFEERLVLFHKSYLFISFAPDLKKPVRTNSMNALVNRAGASIIKNPFEGLNQTLELAERVAADIEQTLSGVVEIELKRMGEGAIRNLYLQYFNLDFDSQPTALQRELMNDGGALTVGEKKVNIVSLVGQGSEAHLAVRNGYGVTAPMIYPLTNYLNCPHILTQALLIQDTRESLKALDTDKKLNGSLAMLASQDNEQRIAEIDLFTAEMRANNKQVVNLHLSVLLWDTDDQVRSENVGRTATAFRSMFGAESVVESFLTLPLFFGLLPGSAYQIPDRWITTSADRSSCYLNWTTTYRPEKTGEYFCDRFRNLVRINLFNTDLDNQNALVIGPSGSGKSYTFGSIVVQRYERGARQILIDIGGSYKNVCESLTGSDFENTYFTYDPEKPIEFNPFLLPRNEETQHWEYIDEKLNFHLALLAALWKGGRSLDKSERVVLGKFLKGYYAHLNNDSRIGHRDEEFPGMQGFYDYVKHHHADMTRLPVEGAASDGREELRRQYHVDQAYIDINQFFLVLAEFVKGGRYEKVLNAKRDKDLSEYRLICFDLAKVKGDETLYPVVGMLITELALDLFRKFPKDVKYIALDEAWALLQGTLSEFIESMYRTIRKTNGSITIITQGIAEIVNSNIGSAIITNSSTKIILRHTNPGPLNAIQVPLGFTDHEMDLVRSCRDGGTFRELFIKQGTKGKVYVLEAAPQLNAIFTSKAHEREYLKDLVERYMQRIPVVVKDLHGNTILDQDGQPVINYKEVRSIGPAVDQFIEDKNMRVGGVTV